LALPGKHRTETCESHTYGKGGCGKIENPLVAVTCSLPSTTVKDPPEVFPLPPTTFDHVPLERLNLPPLTLASVLVALLKLPPLTLEYWALARLRSPPLTLARLLHLEVVVDKVGSDFGAGEERSRKAD